MTSRSRPLIALAAAVLVAASAAGCDLTGDAATTTAASRTTPSPPAPRLRGEAARAAAAVDRLARALRDGDVDRLCRPDALFSAAVVEEMGSGGVTCEASVEDTLTAHGAPATTVARMSVEPGLATAQVRLGDGHTVPLTLVRDGRRWLVSFSDGNDPLSALTE